MPTRPITGAPTLALALGLSACAGCGRKPKPAPPAQVTVVRTAALPGGPTDPGWERAPAYEVKLLLQDIVEPRQLRETTRRVLVRALTDGRRLALRLRWDDGTKDDLPGAARFPDACAVQLPAVAAPGVPAPQMGEPRRRVEIAYWRASWQAVVDGRKDDIRALYPGATVDHYPPEAPSLKPGSPEQRAFGLRYAPARALGNRMAGPRTSPVEDLVAEGPGTLRPAERQQSDGRGVRKGKGWLVMIHRPLPEALARAGGRTQVALAVWQGGEREVGARKMRSAWVPLALQEGR